MKNKLTHIFKVILLILAVLNVNTSVAQQQMSYNILFTGNISKNKIEDDSLLKKWQEKSYNSNETAFLMLGNILNSKEIKLPESMFINNEHPLLLAPGENEWENGKASGKEKIKDIKNKISEKYKGEFYMPNPACPGPKEVVLNEHLVVILIDTHWWVHKHDRRFLKCGIESNQDVILRIEDAIRRHYKTKHVVIAGHHSLKSYGNSDGYFSVKQTILEAPYTLFRRTLGTRKDNHHPDFMKFRNNMLSVLKKYPDVIYTSAGDENLQYFNLESTHHIVSGSFSNTQFVRKKTPEFASSKNGFGQLSFSDDGNCELSFIGSKGNLFKKTLYHKEFATDFKLSGNNIKFKDSILANASDKYFNPKAKYIMKGKNYREVWDTPIKVPVFNIRTEKDSLFVVKRGGGKQTLSLRLEDKDGRQYVLRSLEKNVEAFLPAELENTFAVDLIQDQISTSNPYGALVVAELSEYANIYHTNPKVVYVPDDANFGIYQKDVSNQLFLFEERPDDDRIDVASFGSSKNIISTADMIENILHKKNHFVDSEAYIRARLFDILINDWDRHEDQWRWASFKDGKKTIYKPIPRDRDQAFFLSEGAVAWVSARKWISPRFQFFDEYTENVEGLSFNARYLDRNLLIQNEWKDWQKQIDSLQVLLTPERIDKSVLKFPEEVQKLCANQTAEVLKARIKNLEPMAKQLYLFLAEEVNITGTDSKDLFEISVADNETIDISRFQKNNKPKNKIYSRTFDASETNKIRIYGFDGDDSFIIKGNAKNKIKLSIIGGKNKDSIIYESNKTPQFISVYDKKSTGLSNSMKNRRFKNYDSEELKYDRRAYKYDITYPSLFVAYNEDDGIFLGGGAKINKFSRYEQKTFELLGNYSFLSNSYNFHFEGEKKYLLKHLQLSLVADFKSPNYTNNYFGMGNETEWLVDKSEKEYYRVRMGEYYSKLNFTKSLDKKDIHQVSLGLFYKNIDIEKSPSRFISDYTLNNLNSDALLSHSYAGASFNYKINTISKENIKTENQFGGRKVFPIRGTILETEFSQFVGLNDVSQNFSKLSGEYTSYISFSKRPRIVYAVKLGGEKLFGDYVFSESAKLGQKENLRGYMQTRFYGDASLYLNTEVRIRVKDFKSYILNGTAGLFLFNDVARVWYENESSSTWHNGFGGGLWWTPFDMTLISVSYAKSKEDNLFNISINYQF